MTTFSKQLPIGVGQSEMIGFYRRLLGKYGSTHYALSYWSKEDQEDNFRILSRKIKPGYKMIDFGCGLGDLYGFLQKGQLLVDYKGFDLVPEMIKAARRKYPQAQFSARGSLKGLPSKHCDYLIASGAFSYRLPDHQNHIVRTLREFTRVARQGFSFNLLTTRALLSTRSKLFTVTRKELNEILRGYNFEVETSSTNYFVFVDGELSK